MLSPVWVTLAVAMILAYFLMIFWTQFPREMRRLTALILGQARRGAAAAMTLGAAGFVLIVRLAGLKL